MRSAVIIVICLSQIALVKCFRCDIEPKTAETRLKKKLLCAYEKTERPVLNQKDAVNVGIYVVLDHFDFDDKDQKIFLNTYTLMMWKDYFINWIPREFDNISTLLVNSDDIWTPEIQHYSSHDSNNLQSKCFNPKTYMHSNGLLMTMAACDYNALCQTDYTNWPFDTHNCTLSFGSFPDSGEEVNFTSNTTALKTVATNKHLKWKIVSAKISKHTESIENSTYPTLVLNYILERHAGTNIVLVTTPALVLCLMNLLIFWLKIDSFERKLLHAINIFSHITYIQLLYWCIPYNGESTPLTLIFFRNSLVLSGALLIFTICLRLISESESKPPSWIDFVTVFFVSHRLGDMMCAIGALDLEKNSDASALSTVDLNEAISKLSSENIRWRQFAKVLDRTMCFAVLITYFVLIVVLVPTKFATQEDNSLNYLKDTNN